MIALYLIVIDELTSYQLYSNISSRLFGYHFGFNTMIGALYGGHTHMVVSYVCAELPS